MPCSSSSISASDFLPKLRYFSSSCGVFCTSSPIVWILASRRQWAERTESSSSEIGVLSFSWSSSLTAAGASSSGSSRGGPAVTKKKRGRREKVGEGRGG